MTTVLTTDLLEGTYKRHDKNFYGDRMRLFVLLITMLHLCFTYNCWAGLSDIKKKQMQNEEQRRTPEQTIPSTTVSIDARLDAVVDPEVLFEMGRKYLTQSQWEKGIEAIYEAAVLGHPGAQSSVGSIYTSGLWEINQDYKKAVMWYRKAAEQGYPEALYSLGLMYANGQGVTQDYMKAVMWYRKAAEQGDSNAQNSLGDMYADGQGVTQDYMKAVMWYRKAAEQGDSNAQCLLGLMHAQGYCHRQCPYPLTNKEKILQTCWQTNQYLYNQYVCICSSGGRTKCAHGFRLWCRLAKWSCLLGYLSCFHHYYLASSA
ncbi:MAG: TPR repeat protein [Desulforhopalus sp.]|jgi:TPR repeat protein